MGGECGGERDSRAVSKAKGARWLFVAPNSPLARGLAGGDSAAPASIACTVALAGRSPPSATAWARAAAAATAAEEGSSERARMLIVVDVSVFFNDSEALSSCSCTLALLLSCIYLSVHSTLARMGAITAR